MARIDDMRKQSKELLVRVVDTSLFDDINEGSASEIDINITLGFRPGEDVSILSAEKVVRYNNLGYGTKKGPHMVLP